MNSVFKVISLEINLRTDFDVSTPESFAAYHLSIIMLNTVL